MAKHGLKTTAATIGVIALVVLGWLLLALTLGWSFETARWR